MGAGHSIPEILGVPCPKCGCRHTLPGQKITWLGFKAEKRRCRFCGHIFTHPITETIPPDKQPKAVIYHVLKCPQCRSAETTVTSSVRPVRYHKCDSCGHTFKSIETAG